ncbi:MAG: hypothetical protein ACTH8F_08295 [Microbacterium sp.]|uniref:hypothetical protein n=1 Tax=Microbacterium sp. TaxID=51671 RepID=UPI003F9D3DBF
MSITTNRIRRELAEAEDIIMSPRYEEEPTQRQVIVELVRNMQDLARVVEDLTEQEETR